MYKVLIVDDEKIVRLAIKSMIRWAEQGLELCGTAANGIAALELVERFNPDIVITDIKMPGMDGVELIRRLKEQGFDGEILVLSNYNDFDLVRDALRHGAHDYVLKVTVKTEDFSKLLGDMTAKLEKRRGCKGSVHAREVGPDALRSSIFKDLLIYGGAGLERAATELAAIYMPQKGDIFFSFVMVREKGRNHADEDPGRVADAVNNMIGELMTSYIWYSVVEIDIHTVMVIAGYHEPNSGDTHEKLAKRMLELTSVYYNLKTGIICSDTVTEYRTLLEGTMTCMKTSLIFFYEKFLGEALPADFKMNEADPLVSEAFKTLAGKVYDALTGAGPDFVIEDIKKVIQLSAEQKLNPYRLKKSMKKILREAERKLIQNGYAGGELFEEYSDDEDVIFKAVSDRELLDVLDTIIKRAYDGIDIAARYQRREVRDAVRYIEKHACEKIALSDIASTVNLNETYLCRIFREDTGKSIVSYVNEVKMMKAYNLLNSGDVLVREAASAVGIDDPFYFNRLFKKHFGITPKEIKNK